MCTLDIIMFELKKQKKTQAQLASHLGMSKNAISEWKSGRNKSYKKHITQIAEYLNVSTDYLLGSSATQDTQLSEFDFALLSETENLTDEQKQSVINYVKFLKSQE